MRLRRLLLHNYRRYAHAEVELPDGVVAVVGPNGSGKSTLLEAVSFALFGPSAIRTSKELLRTDGAAPADAVRVELDLELGGQAVRIVRELRGKGLSPSASLEVDGVVLVPPGAGSSEAATREVERRLGMDRDAFHTTVVAQQGELARLGRAAPAERKRLLLRMLGIDRVERAIEEARARRSSVALALERLRPALPDPARLAAEHAAATQAVAQTVLRMASVTAALEAATGKAAVARDALSAAERLEQSHRVHQVELASAHAQETHLGATVARLGAEVAQAHTAAERIAALAELASQVEPREEKLRQATVAEAARAQHAERLRYLEAQRAGLARLQSELAQTPAPSPATEVAAGQGTADGIVVLESTLQLRSNELAVLESRLADVEQRRRRLSELGPGAPCPTCERPLNGQFEHLHAVVGSAATSLLQERERARSAVADLERQVIQARTASQQEARRQAELQRLWARRMELERRVADEARRLAELEAATGPAPGPAGHVAALRRDVLEARRAREEQVRLETLAARAERAAAELATATAGLEAARARRLLLEAAAPPFDAAALEQARRVAAASEQARLAAEQELQQARLAEERAKASLEAAARRLAEAEEATRHVRDLEAELQLWTAIVGRNGGGLLDRFRDHLVGRVGPAISAEASRLLARFTAGRYTEVLLDEGYQVYVTDGGTPYLLERFSGGEADLVHLALRLAVSRLLAERGGVELRFLALDEVFGSLDRERRDLVVAALRELGGLYSQVLVVSHSEALQEALGNVLRVEEGPDGEAVLAAGGMSAP